MSRVSAPRLRPALPGRRLRTQLLVSFALVALVALIAGGAAVVWLMLDYRTQATTQRLRDAAASAGVAGFGLSRQGMAPSAIASNVADQVPLPGARVLVLDATGAVLADEVAAADTQSPSGTFTGQHLDVPVQVEPMVAGAFFGGRAAPSDRVVVWRGNTALSQARGYLFVAAPAPPSPPPGAPAGQRGPGQPGGPSGAGSPNGQPNGQPNGRPNDPPNGQSAGYRIVLAIPLQSLPSAWQELAPGFAVAATIALFAAAAVAWWLAGSIARPIRTVTAATARVARGEPYQAIPEEGVDEVIQLARGFNTMVREVERSQCTLRDFVADASHELRTPLTTIQGFSQALNDGVLEAPAPTRDAAGLIQRESERMSLLVEDLLLLSKVEAPGRSVVRQPVDVTELIDTLAQRLQLAARDRGLHFVLELPERLLAAGDATQLEHLFGNLMENATKYSPDGGTITVRAALAPSVADRAAGGSPGAGVVTNGQGLDGSRVVVAVHNTGSDIPPDDLPHIFDRFYRVDKSRSRQVAGSGLGLAIAREVAERHGGNIGAASDPATGTTFTVTLPAVAGQSAGVASAESPGPVRRPAPYLTWRRTPAAGTGHPGRQA